MFSGTNKKNFCPVPTARKETRLGRVAWAWILNDIHQSRHPPHICFWESFISIYPAPVRQLGLESMYHTHIHPHLTSSKSITNIRILAGRLKHYVCQMRNARLCVNILFSEEQNLWSLFSGILSENIDCPETLQSFRSAEALVSLDFLDAYDRLITTNCVSVKLHIKSRSKIVANFEI